MIKEHKHRTVLFTEEPENKFTWCEAKVIDGLAEVCLVIESGEPDMTLKDAKIFRDFFSDIVKAIEDTLPKEE